jgi:hypothetical protein
MDSWFVGSYLQLLDLIPGLQVRLYAAFYDCRAPNRGKDVGGTIGSVDGDVAMNVCSALRFNDVVSKTRWWCGSAGTRAFRLSARLLVGWGISKSDVTSVELYYNITTTRRIEADDSKIG